MPLRSFLFIFCIFCCACGSPSRDESREQPVFRMNMSGGSLESLDPAFAKDLFTMWTAHMLYNTLVETDSALQLQASLARSWTVSADGLDYTFRLRSDVFFHGDAQSSGRRMTASDVVFSFNRLIAPETASPGAWIFNDRVRPEKPFEAPDDSTFVLHLRKPFRPMIAMLSMPYCSVVCPESVQHFGKDFRAHPCGTGPFSFLKWDEGNALILHKNKRYWETDSNGKRLPYLAAVQISFIDSKAGEFLLFLQKKIDFTHSLDGSFKDLILRKDGMLKPEFAQKFNLRRGKYLNTEYLGILTDTASPLLRNSPLRDKKIRRAMNFAIDKEKLIRYFKNGIGSPASGGFTPPGIAGFPQAMPYGYRYDPQQAAQLLREAGYPAGKGLPTITVLTPENFADIVNFVCTQWAEVGIPAKIEVMQPNILKQQMSRSQALCFRAQWIADYPDAETYLSFFDSRFPAPPNYTRYRNKEFDRLYDMSINLPDSERFAVYRKMDSIAVSDAPVVPLFYDQYLHFTQKNVAGLSSNPMNLIDLKRVFFTNTQK